MLVQKIKLPNISAIILAAGKSSRMKTPKPLLNLDKEALINFQIKSLKNSHIEEIIVVLGSNAEEIKKVILSNEVKKIIRNTGTTTIMVTHDEIEAERLSDECFLLENGKIRKI